MSGPVARDRASRKLARHAREAALDVVELVHVLGFGSVGVAEFARAVCPSAPAVNASQAWSRRLRRWRPLGLPGLERRRLELTQEALDWAREVLHESAPAPGWTRTDGPFPEPLDPGEAARTALLLADFEEIEVLAVRVDGRGRVCDLLTWRGPVRGLDSSWCRVGGLLGLEKPSRAAVSRLAERIQTAARRHATRSLAEVDPVFVGGAE